jgi:hypothetical protein
MNTTNTSRKNKVSNLLLFALLATFSLAACRDDGDENVNTSLPNSATYEVTMNGTVILFMANDTIKIINDTTVVSGDSTINFVDAPFRDTATVVLAPPAESDTSSNNGRNPIEFAVYTESDTITSLNGGLIFVTNTALSDSLGFTNIGQDTDLAIVEIFNDENAILAAVDPRVAKTLPVQGNFNYFTAGNDSIPTATYRIIAGLAEIVECNEDEILGQVTFTGVADTTMNNINGDMKVRYAQYSALFSGTRTN